MKEYKKIPLPRWKIFSCLHFPAKKKPLDCKEKFVFDAIIDRQNID
jgi:hypothetical protein